MAVACSRSRTRRAAVPAGCSRGSAWDRPRRRSSPSFATCGRAGQTEDHGERHQPRLDGGQRVEYAAEAGTRSHHKLACAWVDTHGSARDTARYRERGDAVLFGSGRVDHRASDLRRWRGIVDEPRSSDRDSARLTRLTAATRRRKDDLLGLVRSVRLLDPP